MVNRHGLVLRLLLALSLASATAAVARAENPPAPAKPFKPYYGMPGRDAVWVPTPHELVEKMLDIAKVTDKDVVMDLGSGDGRNIIAAARRGARAIGVEYNPDLVAESQKTAEKEGVADKARFVQGDMYKADISEATVLALFLLPENMDKMVDKFLAMRPGSRIVVNGFRMSHWDYDETGFAGGKCTQWCTAYLWIVPARAGGRWRLGDGELEINQRFQKFTGTLTRGGKPVPVENGRLRGAEISFSVSGIEYTGKVDGDSMSGTVKGGVPGLWNASRVGG